MFFHKILHFYSACEFRCNQNICKTNKFVNFPVSSTDISLHQQLIGFSFSLSPSVVHVSILSLHGNVHDFEHQPLQVISNPSKNSFSFFRRAENFNDYLCHNEPNLKFLGNSSRFIPRFQIIIARRPVICYTIRNIHFSLTAVSYEPAGLLYSWKQVYIIYLGRGILGCFFYSREQRAK